MAERRRSNSSTRAQAGDYDPATLLMVENMRRHGKPVPVATQPIIELIDTPPTEPLSAFIEGTPISVRGHAFDPAAAHRLDELTRPLLARV